MKKLIGFVIAVMLLCITCGCVSDAEKEKAKAIEKFFLEGHYLVAKTENIEGINLWSTGGPRTWSCYEKSLTFNEDGTITEYRNSIYFEQAKNGKITRKDEPIEVTIDSFVIVAKGNNEFVLRYKEDGSDVYKVALSNDGDEVFGLEKGDLYYGVTPKKTRDQ